MEDPKFKPWLIKQDSKKSLKGKNELGYCKFCQCSIIAHKATILRHSKSDKHKLNSQQITENHKINEAFQSTPLNTNIKRAEIKLCGLLATSNLSFSLMDSLSPLLKDIFPDSQIAKGLNIKRTKATSIVKDNLGKQFAEELYDKLRVPGRFFSLIMDETTDISTKKQCAFSVIYYDTIKNKTITEFFDLTETEGSHASELFELLKNAITAKKIPLQNFIGFSSDTTNVMAGNNNSVFSLLKKNFSSIVCIKCSCHMAHLAISKACLKLPRSVEDLLRNIGSHFHRSHARIKKLEEFQEYFQTGIHKILSPSITRWLSIKSCVDRVLEQYEPLQAYLRVQVFEDPSITTEQMLSTMENRFTIIYLEFMSYVLGLMTEFNTVFQTEKPLLHVVKPETQKLLKTLCANYMEISFIKRSDVFKLNHENPEHFVPLNKIYLGISATESIKNISNNPEAQSDCEKFYKTILTFYIDLIKQIKQRFNFEDDIYDILSVVDPIEAQAFKVKSLKFIVDRFPVLYSYVSIQQLDNEWKAHALLDYHSMNMSTNDAEKYWGEIFNLKNAGGVELFPNLKIVMSMLLILPFSNASVERIFSNVVNIKTDKRNLLDTSTLRALLCSKSGIESQGGCVIFTPNANMINAKIWHKKK